MRLAAVVILGFVMSLLSGCSAEVDTANLSAIGLEGRQIARDSGCAACHGPNGEGGTGPQWKELAGSTVSFNDFTTAVADKDYLTEAIADPGSQIRDGFALKMPENSLTADEIEKVVAYIEELR